MKSTTVRRLAWRVSSVATLGLSASALSCSSEAPVEPSSTGRPAVAEGDSPVYRHPLSGVSNLFAADKLPIFDSKDSPTGKRYAIGDSTVADEASSVVLRSGVIEVTRERAAPSELVPRASTAPAAIVDPALANRSGALKLNVALRRPSGPGLTHRLQEAVARGRVATRAARLQIRDGLVKARRGTIAAAQDPVVAEIERLGGTVLSRCQASYCLTISLDADQIGALVAAAPTIQRIDEQTPMFDEAVDGKNMATAIQVDQFYGSPAYDGWDVNPFGLDVGQFESSLAEIGHVGFNVNSTSWSRILAQYDCSGTCTSNISGATTGDHATAVAGLMLGSLTNAQDSRYTTANDRLIRSGYARSAQLVSYSGNYTNSMDHLLDTLNGPPEILNMSSGNDDDPNCTGQDTRSGIANDVFEDGIAFFKSAGNDGNADEDDCRVTSPGSAIGVMPIANNGNNNYTSAGTGVADIRTSPIRSTSSRGGTSTQGGGRTIIGLTAYGCRTKLFDTDGDYDYADCGTSFSSPTVVGAALDFMDHYMSVHGDFIDDPGVLYSSMLLMGDRQGESGKITSDFDGVWGAGRLQARRRDAAGIDSPGSWGTYTTCIDHGENYNFELNSDNAFSSDTDILKAVIWWYDRQHETGGGVDNIDLRVQTYNTATAAWETKRTSNSTGDNKERVFVSGATIQSKRVRLRITGADVTNDDTGCGSNSMKVYLSYLYEDSDRDDGDGPSSSVLAE